MKTNELKKLVFVDCETTAKLFKPGISTCEDSIVEAAAAIVNLDTREIELEKNWLIKPHGPQSFDKDHIRMWDLGDFHIKNGHFKDTDWNSANEWIDVMAELSTSFLASSATIAGQNPKFDLDHFQRDFAELNIEWPKLDYHIIDIAPAAIFLVMAGIVPGMSLRHTSKWAGCSTQKHRALDDVHDTIKVFWAMYDFYILNKKPNE